jgi:glycosyltransferase involved in cell wall biosynthesis
MNILYVNSKKNWGGVASWMVKTALGLEKKGHKVIILSAKDSKFTKEAPNTLNILPCKFGFDYNPKTIFIAVNLIKKHKIDLVLTNIEKEIAVGGVAAKFCGIKNIRRVGRHDDFNDSKKKIRYRHEKFVDYSIVPCNAVFEEAVKHSPWLKNHKFITIYNGRNPRVFEEMEIIKLRNTWKIKENDIVVGITSQLTSVKNIDSLIRAFKKVSDIFEDVKLVITGFGKEESSLKRLSSELGLEDKVIFTGFTDNPQFIASAYDIGISVSFNEGFPNTIVEYMSVGTPVISTDVGGVKEILIDGVNGLLTGFNPNEISESILYLIGNKELRQKIGRNGFKTVSENFTEEKMINELEKFFRTVAMD